MAEPLNMDRNYKVIIFSDSRGRNLARLLNRIEDSTIDISYEVHVLPGATLDLIHKKIERSSRRYSWDLCIIIAGICDLTVRVVTRTHRYLEYTNRRLIETKSIINQILDSQEKTHISTITPALLSKYSSYRNNDPTIEDEQKNLMDDIEDINRHIISRSIQRDVPTINLAKLSYDLSLKKQGNKHKRITKFSDKNLPDGIHPSIKLEEQWAKYISKQTEAILIKQASQQQLTESTEDETDDDDSNWNFKRQKMEECG